jgi:predicted N-acetyltransferase YhbS
MIVTAQELLLAYDAQLRTDAETVGAIALTRLGPLLLVTHAGGRGFVTYRDLECAGDEEIPRLVSRALDYFRQDPAIFWVEWKARGHDGAPGLHQALLDHGFEPDEPESIMIGHAWMLDVQVPLPAGVELRHVTEHEDVLAMTSMQDVVFGSTKAEDMAEELVRRLAIGDGLELWVAEAEGQIVCAGRLDPVAGTDFAGIWGGATHTGWRGQGIYRALTAARARSAMTAGKTLIYSESTEYSRPILERSGFVKVSTTTPYNWRR